MKFSLRSLRDPDDEEAAAVLVVKVGRHSVAIIEATNAAKRFAVVEVSNVTKAKPGHGHDHATFGEELFLSNDFLECVSVAMTKATMK